MHSLQWQFSLIKDTEMEILEQKQLEDLAYRITTAAELKKLEALAVNQAKMCEVMLTERLEKMDFQPDQIKDAEFVGIYEMVVDHLCPIDLEHIVVEADRLTRKQ